MPALSYHFHLTPADVWALTGYQYQKYSDALDQIRKEATSG